jgi:hypothetical protein
MTMRCRLAFPWSVVVIPVIDDLRAILLLPVQGEASGRVLKYDSTTQLVTIIADGFWYSNGVALSEDETFLLVVETCLSRVIRIWLRGEKVSKAYSRGPGPCFALMK